jgi:hypothetical protein
MHDVDLDKIFNKIRVGSFSTVYKGTWHKLFTHEISIWKCFKRPNIIELLGVSSAKSRLGSSLVLIIVRDFFYLVEKHEADLLRRMHQVVTGWSICVGWMYYMRG